MLRALCLPLACLVLVACTQFPELDATVPPSAEAADYPDLIPLDLAAPPPVPPDAEAPGLEARVDRLRARADRLRRDVVEEEERGQMERGVPRG